VPDPGDSVCDYELRYLDLAATPWTVEFVDLKKGVDVK